MRPTGSVLRWVVAVAIGVAIALALYFLLWHLVHLTPWLHEHITPWAERHPLGRWMVKAGVFFFLVVLETVFYLAAVLAVRKAKH